MTGDAHDPPALDHIGCTLAGTDHQIGASRGAQHRPCAADQESCMTGQTQIRVGWRTLGANARPADLWDGTWEDARQQLLGDLRDHAMSVAAEIGRLVSEQAAFTNAAAFARASTVLARYHDAVQRFATMPHGSSVAERIGDREYWLTVEPA